MLAQLLTSHADPRGLRPRGRVRRPRGARRGLRGPLPQARAQRLLAALRARAARAASRAPACGRASATPDRCSADAPDASRTPAARAELLGLDTPRDPPDRWLPRKEAGAADAAGSHWRTLEARGAAACVDGSAGVTRTPRVGGRPPRGVAAAVAVSVACTERRGGPGDVRELTRRCRAVASAAPDPTSTRRSACRGGRRVHGDRLVHPLAPGSCRWRTPRWGRWSGARSSFASRPPPSARRASAPLSCARQGACLAVGDVPPRPRRVDRCRSSCPRSSGTWAHGLDAVPVPAGAVLGVAGRRLVQRGRDAVPRDRLRSRPASTRRSTHASSTSLVGGIWQASVALPDPIDAEGPHRRASSRWPASPVPRSRPASSVASSQGPSTSSAQRALHAREHGGRVEHAVGPQVPRRDRRGSSSSCRARRRRRAWRSATSARPTGRQLAPVVASFASGAWHDPTILPWKFSAPADLGGAPPVGVVPVSATRCGRGRRAAAPEQAAAQATYGRRLQRGTTRTGRAPTFAATPFSGSSTVSAIWDVVCPTAASCEGRRGGGAAGRPSSSRTRSSSTP